MTITTRLVDAVAMPMIYVRQRSSMQPDEIGKAVEYAFSTLGQFLAVKGVTPLGPPLAVYSDWNGRLVTVDVGFPVTEADAAKASGEVKAGRTPAGAAVKTVHKGSYDGLKETYASLDAAMKRMVSVQAGSAGKSTSASPARRLRPISRLRSICSLPRQRSRQRADPEAVSPSAKQPALEAGRYSPSFDRRGGCVGVQNPAPVPG